VSSGPVYSWNSGQGLARSITSTTSYLQTAYLSDPVSDVGVYYRRGISPGTTWGTAKLINRAGEVPDAVAIGAGDPFVHVVYRTIAGSAGSGFGLNVRVNTNYGASTAWLPTTGGVDTVGRP